jgi:hypothetical protein
MSRQLARKQKDYEMNVIALLPYNNCFHLHTRVKHIVLITSLVITEYEHYHGKSTSLMLIQIQNQLYT